MPESARLMRSVTPRVSSNEYASSARSASEASLLRVMSTVKWAAPSRIPRKMPSTSMPSRCTSSSPIQPRSWPGSLLMSTVFSHSGRNLLVGSPARSRSQPSSRRSWSPRSRGFPA